MLTQLNQSPDGAHLIEHTLLDMKNALDFLSLCHQDNCIYEKERNMFIEFYFILRQNNKPILDANSHLGLLMQGIAENMYSQAMAHKNIQSMYHNVMILRILSDICEKGIGDAPDIQKGISWLEMEILMKDRDRESYGFTYYQLSKLYLYADGNQ